MWCNWWLSVRHDPGGKWDSAFNRSEEERSQIPINSKYLFVASMDVDPDKEGLFNETYDTEHVPNLLKVPAVHAACEYI
jgi:hypothetical protein